MMLDKAKEVSEVLKVLANENRLLLVCHLLEKPMTVSELNESLSNLTQSAISQHLAMLKAHKIVDYNKKGLTSTYFILDQRVSKLVEVLRDNYC
nr:MULTISPECIES: metalloregulator ArsR/SmtB family transcription factor [Clostridium]